MKKLDTKAVMFIFLNLSFSFIITRFIYYTMKESNRIELVKNYIDNFKLMGDNSFYGELFLILVCCGPVFMLMGMAVSRSRFDLPFLYAFVYFTLTLILLSGLFSVYFNFKSLIFNIMLFGSIYMFNSAVKNVFLELQTSQEDYY